MPPERPSAVLVAIPAHNEAATIERVVRSVRTAAPHFDVLVVDDGSTDGTERLAADVGATVVTHPTNLGYGRTLQTAIQYARERGYDVLVTFDADGQHRAEDLGPLCDAFARGSYDLLIGSRFVARRAYAGVPATRRVGMWLFSAVTRLFTRQRVYDTSSGLKVINRQALEILSAMPFVDCHAEVIVPLIRAGKTVGEFPVTVEPRRHGSSMYDAVTAFTYSLKVLFLIAAGTRLFESNAGRK